MRTKYNYIKKMMGAVILFAFAAAMLLAFAPQAVRTARADESAPNGLSISFDAGTDAELFEAYYSANGETATRASFDEHWEISDGKLVAKTNTGYASLVLRDIGLQSYEMQVDYTVTGGDGAMVLQSKMRRKGVISRGAGAESFTEYGCGLYVESDGTVCLEGDFRSVGTGEKKKLSSYDAAATHTLKLRVFDDAYTVWVDGEKVIDSVYGGGIGFMGLQAARCTGTFDNFGVKRLDIHGEVADLYPEEEIVKVAAVGDSLTFGSLPNRYIAADTTVGQLQSLLGDGYDVRNFGLGGRTAIRTSGSCIMDDAEYELACAYKADIIYIMLGTNDSQTTAGYWGNDFDAGARLFVDGYQDVIDGLKASSPEATMYLVVSPTYRHTGLEHLTEEMIATRARVYTPQIAEANGFACIDANAVTKDIATSHLFDYIHFDRYGYGLIADAIYRQIVKDCTEELAVSYDDGITLKIGETATLRQQNRTNPLWTVTNGDLATTAGNVLTANAAGTTTVVASLGTQKKEVTLRVVNNFTLVVSVQKNALTYGDALPALVATLPVAGELRYDEGTAPVMGTHAYGWTFTPAESKYAVERGTVELTYAKATPAGAVAPVVHGISVGGGESLRDVKLPDGYAWKDETTKLKEGKNTAVALYVPQDTEHFETVEYTVSFWAVPETEKASGGAVAGFILLGIGIGLAAGLGGFMLYRTIRKRKAA